MDIASILATGTAAADAIKTAIGLARKANQAELEKVLLDLRDDIATLRDANIELRNENRELREKLSVREELTFADNAWWKIDNAGKREGPYCPKCFGGQDKAVRMGYHETRIPRQETSRWYNCAVCGHTVKAVS